MTLLKTFIEDFREGFRAMQERRDPFWYLQNHFITPTECLRLEQLEQTNGGGEY
jgi:hypothetical protein